jgi:hypothetical protein
MNIPNWFKIVWWFALLAALTIFLSKRYHDLVIGNGTTVDALALLIWVSLALAPIFQDINLFGLKFKQEVESLKEHVSNQISSLRTEIRTNIHTEVNPHINVPGYPPPDSELPMLKGIVQEAVNGAIKQAGLPLRVKNIEELEVPSSVRDLFAARHNVEKELRRIWRIRVDKKPERRFVSINKILSDLVDNDLILPGLATAIAEVYSVCSPAIHGEEFTKAQVNFIKDTAIGIISTLRTIQ